MPSLLFHSGFYNAPFFLTSILVAVLFIAAIYDVKTFTIPHIFPVLLVTLYIVKIFWVGSNFNFLPWHLVSVIIAFSLGLLLFAMKLMGGGDVKLFAALAIWFFPLGLLGLIFCIALSGVAISSGIIVYKMTSQSVDEKIAKSIQERFNNVKKTRIPYGPAIAVGTVFYLFFSNNFVI